MIRGFWTLLAVASGMLVWSGNALGQAAAPVISAKAAIQQQNGTYEVTASGTYTLVNKQATNLEVRTEVQWIHNGQVVTPAVGSGIQAVSNGVFNGAKPNNSTVNTQALPQVRVSIWGSSTPGAAKTRQTPYTEWQTMPRQ